MWDPILRILSPRAVPALPPIRQSRRFPYPVGDAATLCPTPYHALLLLMFRCYNDAPLGPPPPIT
ncbi:hypothetical protein BC937DRAFT_89576 [Endogone sp. FLAS-F59071]|nr:hypothetical protein BC937DRAFT_89576 [Endogone sp. FLAS-F59071]|eukprot:RUS23267.1 hypothetical protein BC937DRAFT_89576 [Endogone sp. FLAS-F59071]